MPGFNSVMNNVGSEHKKRGEKKILSAFAVWYFGMDERTGLERHAFARAAGVPCAFFDVSWSLPFHKPTLGGLIVLEEI